MSENLESSPSLDELAALLRASRHLAFSPKDKTFFSIGGRGYYENPTSDVLAFFMRPDELHGLGSLFLRAFFEVLGVDHSLLSFENVTVSREEPLEGGRIDLFVRGQGWSLVIENKIRHWLANDLTAYVQHATRDRPEVSHFAILSPYGETASGWSAVTYKEYCAVLRISLGKEFFDQAFSKWQVFAKEFVVHLEEELYGSERIMTKEQITFVEKNLHSIGDVKKMSDAYGEFLKAELKEHLEAILPNHVFVAAMRSWGVECLDQLCSKWGFALEIDQRSETRFRAFVWLKGLTDQQYSATVVAIFANMQFSDTEEGWKGWGAKTYYPNRSLALKELCDLAQQLAAYWLSEGVIAPPQPVILAPVLGQDV